METDSFRVAGSVSATPVEPYQRSGDQGRRDAERRERQNAAEAEKPEDIDPQLLAPEEQEVGQVIDVSV